MGVDVQSRTIFIGSDETDVLPDMGVLWIDELRKDSRHANSPRQLQNDWKIIEQWLGCVDRELNEPDLKKIEKAWRSYFAVGLAPSIKLQPIFDQFSELQTSRILLADKPPVEVMDVFDRMLASDGEILEKKEIDFANERKKFDEVFRNSGKDKKSSTRLIPSLSKKTRIFFVFSLAWISFVILRTSDDYEFIGMYFEEWEDGMLVVNALLPPSIIFLSYRLYKWISAAER